MLIFGLQAQNLSPTTQHLLEFSLIELVKLLLYLLQSFIPWSTVCKLFPNSNSVRLLIEKHFAGNSRLYLFLFHGDVPLCCLGEVEFGYQLLCW